MSYKSRHFSNASFTLPQKNHINSLSLNNSLNCSISTLHNKSVHISSTIQMVINHSEIWKPKTNKAKNLLLKPIMFKIRSRTIPIKHTLSNNKQIIPLSLPKRNISKIKIAEARSSYADSRYYNNDTKNKGFIGGRRNSFQYSTNIALSKSLKSKKGNINPYMRLMALLKKNINRRGLPIAVGQKITAMVHSRGKAATVSTSTDDINTKYKLINNNLSKEFSNQSLKFKKEITMKLPSINLNTSYNQAMNDYC